MIETVFQPVVRQGLADDIAQRIKQLIQSRGYQRGERLPSIAEMARDFGVGSPTLREALKKLETLGVVAIRHGSGVYVGDNEDSLVISNPIFDQAVSKKLLVDLIEARLPIEMKSAFLAAGNATEENLDEMEQLLDRAGDNLHDAVLLNETNMAFHRQIAVASGNTVLRQILEVLSSLFQHEQRIILGIEGSRGDDHAEHVGIYEALRVRNEMLATERMQRHLERVRVMLHAWDPEVNPVT